MLSIALLLTLFALLAIFMTNRLIVGLRHGELNIRGWIYSRESTPVRFWLTMVNVSLALLISLSTVVVLAWGTWEQFGR